MDWTAPPPQLWARTARAGLVLQQQLPATPPPSGEVSPIRCVAVHAARGAGIASCVAAASASGTIVVFGLARRKGRLSMAAQLKCTGTVHALALSAPSTLVTVSGQRGTNKLQVWDLRDNAHRKVVAWLDGPMSAVLSLWARHGRIACGDQSGQIQLWEQPAELSPVR